MLNTIETSGKTDPTQANKSILFQRNKAIKPLKQALPEGN